MKTNWTWMPHAAHYIVGDHCQFHLATELGNGIIVSTVGEYWPERVVREIHAEVYDIEWLQNNHHLKGDIFDHAYMQRFGFEQIGVDRTYETMVFKSVSTTPRQCPACPFKIENGNNYDFDSYNDGGDAYRGHLAMCEKWATKSASDLTDKDNEV